MSHFTLHKIDYLSLENRSRFNNRRLRGNAHLSKNLAVRRLIAVRPRNFTWGMNLPPLVECHSTRPAA